jgi:transcriptional regulator GlxA family with amidase domain
MFKALNEEPGEHSLPVLHSLAQQENSSPRQPQFFNIDATKRAGAAAPAVYARGGLSPRVVRRLRDHIDSNIDQRISVEALARLAKLSVCHFVRAFKQSVGLTPHDYLIRRRVERTMELLAGTDMLLSEIAAAAGFADHSHCARRFRQHVGMSLRDYRSGGLP